MTALTKTFRPWRIVAVVVVLLGCYFAISRLIPAYRQSVAIREIERLEGRIQYNSVAPSWLVKSRIDPWLRKIGIRLDQVTLVQVPGSGTTDSTLKHIGNLTDLISLSVQESAITDSGLLHIADLENLHTLNLSSTEITAAGLTHVVQLTNLKELFLSNTRISDDDLLRLGALSNLQGLHLLDSEITDDGLLHLRSLPNLKMLVLLRCDNITTDGVEKLQNSLPNCHIVW